MQYSSYVEFEKAKMEEIDKKFPSWILLIRGKDEGLSIALKDIKSIYDSSLREAVQVGQDSMRVEKIDENGFENKEYDCGRCLATGTATDELGHEGDCETCDLGKVQRKENSIIGRNIRINKNFGFNSSISEADKKGKEFMK